MASGSVTLPETGGGTGTGNINSINGDTSANQFIVGSGDVAVNSSGGITTISSTAVTTGTPLTFAGFDSGSLLEAIPGWNFLETPFNGFANIQLNYAPNNLANFAEPFSWNINVAPLQNSPNDSIRLQSVQVNLDSSGTGFTFGTNGQAGELLGGGYNYGGNGAAFGLLRHINMYSGFGNGTDPGTLSGLYADSHSFSISAGITLDGPVHGYELNLGVNAAAISTPNFNVIFMADFSQIPIDLYGYQGMVCQPNIGTMKNNHNFSGSYVGPTITTMEGNAGMYGFQVGGTIGAAGTGGFQGLGINTNITTLPATADYNGISMFSQITTVAATAQVTNINIGTNVTTLHGNFNGAQIFPQIAGGDGDVRLYSGGMGSVTTTGTPKVLDLSGMTANGKQSQFSADSVMMNIGGRLDAASNQGIQIQHVLFTEFHVPAGLAVTGTDCFASVLSPDVDFGSNTSSLALGPNGLGSSFVVFAGQMHGSGSCDLMSALIPTAIFSQDFTMTEWRNVNAYLINAGYTGSCTNATAFYHEIAGAGPFATNHWGLRVVTDMDNYVTRLAINTASQKVTNSSVALEIGGTDRAMMVGSLTTAQKNALTALNGMICYDTDLNKFQGYEAGAWVNLV